MAINYRTRQAAAAVAADAARAQVRAITEGGDVAKESDVVRLFETVDAELGRRTALVNNAGPVGPVGRVESRGRRCARGGVRAQRDRLLLCARDAIRRMATRHGGAGGGTVNVSSIAARPGKPNMWIYAASKAALDTFTFGLAREVGPDGIRVNAVAPGLIDTDPPGRRRQRMLSRDRAGRRSAGSARPRTSARPFSSCCRTPRASSPAPDPGERRPLSDRTSRR